MDFEGLYREGRDRMYQLALRILKNPDEAADAVQSAYAKAFRSRASFRGGASPMSWIYRVVYNTALDRLRAARPSAGEAALESVPDCDADRPEASALREETRVRVHAALEALSEDDRALLCLLMERDLSYKELTFILDCPEAPLRMRASRARRRLRDRLAPAEEEGT